MAKAPGGKQDVRISPAAAAAIFMYGIRHERQMAGWRASPDSLHPAQSAEPAVAPTSTPAGCSPTTRARGKALRPGPAYRLDPDSHLRIHACPDAGLAR